MKKSVPARATYRQLKKRSLSAMLRKNQGNLAFRTHQISMSLTLSREQKSRRDFFINPKLTLTKAAICEAGLAGEAR
ncbi:TPA: hypothetical protein NII17_005154 [Pseudomonas aeruginosa]|nr:hypothetical protein [Pseudomonas aeruginosa]